MISTSRLVAHRGLPLLYPENTLLGFEAAVAAGAEYLEADVQVTADQVPILYHDATAARVSAAPLAISSSCLSELQRQGAFHPQRFGAKFRGVPISTLAQLVARLNDWPHVKLFLEIKPSSIVCLGDELVRSAISQVLAKLVERASIAAVISKHHEILTAFRHAGWPIGWVLPAWDPEHQGSAVQLQPDFLFVEKQRVPADDRFVWQGRWQWVVYAVNEPSEARTWRDRGWSWVETDVLDQLIRHPDWISDAAHESL